MIAHRTGSSLLHDVSCFVPDMLYISTDQAFQIIKQRPDTPIYITYRDPELRFRSGLQVNICQDPINSDEISRPTLELISSYIQKIRYLDFCMGVQVAAEINSPDMYPTYYRRPYHLYDQHIDHCLWRPYLLLLHGYNVKLMCITEWSGHLLKYYPECAPLIQQHERKDANTAPAEGTNILWDAYYSVFGVPARVATHTWEMWMSQEQLVYDALVEYNTRIIASEKPLTNALSVLIDNDLYFSDITTTAYTYMLALIVQINKDRGLNSDLKNHLIDIRSRLANIQNGAAALFH